MFPENPAAELYRRDVCIVETAHSAVGMAEGMPKLLELGLRLQRGERLGPPREEGFLPQGSKETVVTGTLAADRAIALLLRKLKGEPYETEIPVSGPDVVMPPARPIRGCREAALAPATERTL
jgi:glycine reductase